MTQSHAATLLFLFLALRSDFRVFWICSLVIFLHNIIAYHLSVVLQLANTYYQKFILNPVDYSISIHWGQHGRHAFPRPNSPLVPLHLIHFLFIVQPLSCRPSSLSFPLKIVFAIVPFILTTRLKPGVHTITRTFGGKSMLQKINPPTAFQIVFPRILHCLHAIVIHQMKDKECSISNI